MSCHGKKIRRNNHHLKQIQVFHKTRKKQIEVITKTCSFAKLWGSNMSTSRWRLVLFRRGFYVSSATRETWQLKTHVFQDTSIFLIPGVDDIQNGKHIYNPVLRLWLNQPIWKNMSQVANLTQAGVKLKRSLKPPPSHSTRFLKSSWIFNTLFFVESSLYLQLGRPEKW